MEKNHANRKCWKEGWERFQAADDTSLQSHLFFWRTPTASHRGSPRRSPTSFPISNKPDVKERPYIDTISVVKAWFDMCSIVSHGLDKTYYHVIPL